MRYQATQERIGLIRRARRFINGLGRRRYCCICERHCWRFSAYRGGARALSPSLLENGWISSDFDNFWCPFCRCHDRERHLVLYFDHLNLWRDFAGATILHLAPERQLARRIAACRPARYLQGDLQPVRSGIRRMDVMDLEEPESSFDWVICNHVLEHVPDDRRALAELYRVLKPAGRAILQTPFARNLPRTLEEPERIATAAQRLEYYGQEDHLRLYGTDLYERIAAAGFTPELCRHSDLASASDSARYGVNPQEPLFLYRKPHPETSKV